jgi:hypothetical protein
MREAIGMRLSAKPILSKLPVTSVVLVLLELIQFIRATIRVVSISFVLDNAWDTVFFVSELSSFLDHFCNIYYKVIFHTVQGGSILSHLRLNLIPRLLILRRRWNSWIPLVIPSSTMAVAPWGTFTTWVLFRKFVILIILLDTFRELHWLFIKLIFMVAAYWPQPSATLRPHLQIVTLQYRSLNPWSFSSWSILLSRVHV